jgi:hypothetical protein
LDRPDILERTRDAVAYICSNSGETAVLLEEEKELLKYGNFDVLYSKTYTLDGNLKKGADPKNAELCNKLFERKKELFAKTMKQNINVFYDEMEECYFTSFKEVNEKLREINDRWLKTVPEAMALLERRDRIRQELLPKAKEGSEEYKQLVEERDRIARELGDKGIIPYILYASNEKVPGESMGVYENDKKKQIAHFLFQIHSMLLHIISTKQEIFARKNGISLDPNKMVKQETTNTISDENRAKVQLIEVTYKDPKWLNEHRQEIIDSYMNAN